MPRLPDAGLSSLFPLKQYKYRMGGDGAVRYVAGHGLAVGGKVDGDRGALAGHALELDGAAMGLYYRFTDRKAEASTTGRSGS